MSKFKSNAPVAFLGAFAGGIIGGLLLTWAVGQVFDLGLPGQGLAALSLGVSLTAGLSCGLMALLFHSGRSGHDLASRFGGDQTL